MLIRVIIVDDEIDNAEIFAEFLKIKNVGVLGLGRNGLEGVELYKKYKPDVVILDLVMPNYDGFYALEEIKKVNPDARIIIITGYYTELMKKRLASFGIVDIFQKPCSISAIANSLNQKINV